MAAEPLFGDVGTKDHDTAQFRAGGGNPEVGGRDVRRKKETYGNIRRSLERSYHIRLHRHELIDMVFRGTGRR